MSALYETATTIINDVAIDEGLSEATDPLSSTTPEMVRLVRLFNAAGRELATLHDWPQLVATHTFSAATGTTTYAVPTGFAGYIYGTAWNRTQDRALVGPIHPRAWAEAKATGQTHDGWFRFYADSLEFLSDSEFTNNDTIAYEYRSRSWVSSDSGTTWTLDKVTSGTHMARFDPFLMRIALRRAWRQANGFDTSVIEAQFWRAFEAAKSTVTAAGKLSLTPGIPSPYPTTKDRSWSL